nr:Os09g0518266 [Ipomoea batatas]
MRGGRPEGSFAAGVEDRRHRPAPPLLQTERNTTHRQALRRSAPLPNASSNGERRRTSPHRRGAPLPLNSPLTNNAAAPCFPSLTPSKLLHRGERWRPGKEDTGAASRTGLEGPPGRRRRSIVAPARRCGLREPSPPSSAVASTREGKQGRFAGGWGGVSAGEIADTNSLMFLSELPPSSTASLASCFHFAAFSLSITPLSPFITSTKHLSTSSLVTIPFSLAITRIPTSQTSTRYFALVGWSVHCGMATTGTPRLSASRVEFHPQRVTKHPTARWDKTSSCGHQFVIMPAPDLSGKKLLGSLLCSEDRTTHRNLHLLWIKPCAASHICSSFKLAKLPKDT